MYLLTHSLSPVLVLVAVMKSKEPKTKISHANSLTLSLFSHALSYTLSQTNIFELPVRPSSAPSFALAQSLVLSLHLLPLSVGTITQSVALSIIRLWFGRLRPSRGVF